VSGTSTAVISLGANLGDRLGQLQAAVDGLRAHRVSAVYETQPWGDPDQPAYLNAVVVAEAPGREPRDWLALAHALEAAADRRRDPDRRFGPRTLDVDLIDIRKADGGHVTSDDPDLTLPHPRAAVRAFVLVPWREHEPDATVPGAGTVTELLAAPEVAKDLAGVRRRDDLELRPWQTAPDE
jgi:2-amino-4-hydroxy-6-hydroxymethyldihydropteridine diphosphokinase